MRRCFIQCGREDFSGEGIFRSGGGLMGGSLKFIFWKLPELPPPEILPPCLKTSPCLNPIRIFDKKIKVVSFIWFQAEESSGGGIFWRGGEFRQGNAKIFNF